MIFDNIFNLHLALKRVAKLLVIGVLLFVPFVHAEDLESPKETTLTIETPQSKLLALNSSISDLPALLNISPTMTLIETNSSSKIAQSPLTLQKAIELGLENSFLVKAAIEHRESFGQTTRAALGALLPRIDMRVSQGVGRVSNVDPTESRIRKENSLSIHQTLIDLSSLTEYQRQQQLTTVAKIQIQGAVSTSTLDVSSAYLKALQTSLIIAVNIDYNKTLNELLIYMTNRTESGGASAADRDRVKARVANAQFQLADAQANLRTATRNLSYLIGEDPSALTCDNQILLVIPTSIEVAVDEAKIGNPELVAANEEVDAVQLEKKLQMLKVLPTLGVDLTHTQSVNAAGTVSSFNDNKIMMVMSWSIFNGGTDLAQSRAAGFRANERTYLAQDMQRKVNQQLEGAYAVLDAVKGRYDSLRKELDANNAVVEAFKAQLTGGNRQLLDVLDAYERLQRNKIELAQLAVTEAQNHLIVAHLTGRLVPANEDLRSIKSMGTRGNK